MVKLTRASSREGEDILARFLEFVEASGIELYPHQEEAILELYQGKNAILSTPTGSGKSLVALALQFLGLSQGRTSYYTVPIKALANEKFFWLCEVLGPEQVGLITGDATVNPDAPVICCTAEILSNLVLREGAGAPVHEVIMDEFHFYADPSRGSAWQIPLLALSRARFLLMSATLGDCRFFQRELTTLTGKETALVTSGERPVPLDFEYSEDPLQEKVTELVEAGKAPIYLVHFTQAACARTAQNLLSCNFCGKEEKQEIGGHLVGADFRSPYGKDLQRLLRHGLGIHHAGLLPKYRILVEKLAQRGVLKVICGTDTLGVGINVPIRTVLLTQLCKYDGTGTKLLSVRDFNQICGRAGRRGFDTLGTVVAQAPEHVIENLRLERKASSGGGRKRVVKKKPPEKGYVPWDEKTFLRLQSSAPEILQSSFQLQPGMLLNVLSRQREDGCAAGRELLRRCHEPESRRAELQKQAFRLFRSLVEGDIISILPRERREGPSKVVLNVDLQEDFTLTHALGLYLVDAVKLLDQEEPEYPFQVLSLVESILENPAIILRRQEERLKSELVAAMKAEGVSYEDRIERLEEVEYPKPGADFIYGTFQAFCREHPWVGRESIRPKCIAREMFEKYQSFEDYVKAYGLERCEGVLLRYLSEVYRALDQTVPPAALTEELEEARGYFEELLRGVDSSLLDEWEKLGETGGLTRSVSEPTTTEKTELPLSRDHSRLRRLIRSELFEVIKRLAQRNWEGVATRLSSETEWDPARLALAMDPYWDDHEHLRLDPGARANHHTRIRRGSDEDEGFWFVEQTLVDPDERNDWALSFRVDLKTADRETRPVLELIEIGPVLA